VDRCRLITGRNESDSRQHLAKIASSIIGFVAEVGVLSGDDAISPDAFPPPSLSFSISLHLSRRQFPWQ